MRPILETERLVFRPFTAEDFDLLAGLHADPQVQRYIGGLWSREVIQRRLDQYVGDQQRLGFSKWKAFLRDGTFVGRAGVSLMPDTGEPEIGYSFARAAWGEGLASEAAIGVVDWMFANTDVAGLIGFAHVDNAASRRVLEKTGMVFEGERDFDGIPNAFYRLARP
ncbi:GNAT family N-acetyltransferase [Phenylobacterium sp.]|uniref:GNAT family N-acetyltransferase n=1 Tax=Phenylobacterium sp. TaxID=1871053 RepID=UPI0035B1DD14